MSAGSVCSYDSSELTAVDSDEWVENDDVFAVVVAISVLSYLVKGSERDVAPTFGSYEGGSFPCH